jgi:uncharacterized protein (DUF433 family)
LDTYNTLATIALSEFADVESLSAGGDMNLDTYFEIVGPDDIRIKGHRVGMDDVLGYYLDGYSPDEIAAQLPTLSLEQIYATITYYLHNRAEMDAYLARLTSRREQRYQAWAANPPPIIEHLRTFRAERERERVAA